MKVWVVSHLEDPLLCPFTTVMLAHMFEHCIGAHTHTHTHEHTHTHSNLACVCCIKKRPADVL